LLLSSAEELEGGPGCLVVTYRGAVEPTGLLEEAGSGVLHALLDPAMDPNEYEAGRLERRGFVPLLVDDRGISVPWVHSPSVAPDGSVVAVTRTAPGDGGRLVLSAVAEPGRLVAAADPVVLVPPRWGTTRQPQDTDRLDGREALASLGRTEGRVAVLGTTVTGAGRVTAVEVSPEGPGVPTHVGVVSPRGEVQVGPAVLAPETNRVTATAVPLLDGTMVVAGVGDESVDRIVLGSGGRTLAAGSWLVVATVPAEALGRTLRVQGFGDDGSFVGRRTVPVPGAASTVEERR
jgi:hypothetical protein